MFTSLLRRPRQGKRRVSSSKDKHPASIWAGSPAYSPVRRPTADFTEADDDDDDEEDEDEGVSHAGPSARYGDDGEDQDEPERDATPRDEDGRRGALPVLPLFSESHLGKS
jgi:hypothetical protein